MSALFKNDFDRLLRDRIQSHGGVDVKRFKESKEMIQCNYGQGRSTTKSNSSRK